jgi:hypothetical protein
MKSALLCMTILLAASGSAGALEAKKKVVSVVETECASLSAKAKKLDCKPTGSVSGTQQAQQPPQPSLETKPRLGFTASPWIFSGF